MNTASDALRISVSILIKKKAMWMSSSGTSSIIGDTKFRSFFTKSGNSHLNLNLSRKLSIPCVLYFFSLSGVLMRFWYPQLLGFVRIRLTITTKWKSSASFRQSIQKTSVRLSHLSRYVVFQIPLSIITEALRISAFIVINEKSMNESFADYPTFVSKMYRGLNLQFQIFVRFLCSNW